MQETRKLKLESLIREELSALVPKAIRDPRVPPLTFTEVQLTQDGKQATVSFLIFGSIAQSSIAPSQILPTQDSDSLAKDQRMKDCLAGLNSASGFLRKNLAKTLKVRHIPTLVFKEDKGLENTVRVHELLKEIEKEKDARGSSSSQ